MSDMVVLFEDETARTFLPLTYVRPIYDLRCGIFTLRERVASLTGRAPEGICRAHLADLYGAGRWPLRLLSRSTPVTFVNGRALDLAWLPALLAAPVNTIVVADPGAALLHGAVLLGARLSPALASAVLRDLIEQGGAAALAELRRFAHVIEVDAAMLSFPWDLVGQNGAQIARDLPLATRDAAWATAADRPPADSSVVVRAPYDVWLHADAQLDGPLALDARDGPIVIGAARIEPFSFIQGPTAIHAGALISSALIRGETTIGPVCRVSGEIEASVLQGYTNKHHEGFFGHSFLGEWVNVGAMTTTSDLKSTYGSIRVVVEGFGQVDSGVLKLGCFLADHVKLGIGLHLNGGAVIGTGSNLFGTHFAPKTVPPFIWGGESFREYRIDSMVDVARKVALRRKVDLTHAHEAVLREVFAMTRSERVGMGTASLVPAAETALRRAEEEATRA